MGEKEQGPDESASVTITDSVADDRQVSLQVWQEAWYKLTGKVEEVARSWGAPFQITLNHLQSLHKRIEQCCEQYIISAVNFQVVVFYADDHSERFTSWQRFNTHATVDAVAVESVQLTYDFLITPPKTKTPQAYTITLRIASRVTVMKRLRPDSFLFGSMPKIVRQIGGRTAEARIKYVDYVIARAMLHTIDEWTKTLPRASVPRAFRWLERNSSIAPPIFRAVLAAIAFLCAIEAIPRVFESGESISRLAYFLVATFAAIAASFGVGHLLGRTVERALDDYSSLSYLELTSGDTAAIAEARKLNAASIFTSVGATVVTFGLSILSRFTSGWLLHWIASR